MITSKAHEKIYRFNSKKGLHYNIVATEVYKERNRAKDLFGEEYQSYITAALISFDMGRMMGRGGKHKYDVKAKGFATKLHKKIIAIKPSIKHLSRIKLIDIHIENEKESIIHAYNILSVKGPKGLNQQGAGFHVGVTKILHFINPELFLIIDSNASRSFRFFHNVKFRNSSQPGYSAEKYVECLCLAKEEILAFGIAAFQELEKGVPITRIYDKLTFITGSELSSGSHLK